MSALKTIIEKPAIIDIVGIQNKKLDEKTEQKWIKLGLPRAVLETHPDCAQFLLTTGIAYSIVGFANATDSNEVATIRFDDRGPLLKLQGDWVPWEEIKKILKQDSNDKTRIVSQADPQQFWTYISPLGLVPEDRLDYKTPYPVHLLSKRQYEKVRTSARLFPESNPPETEGEEDDSCILQLMTTHHKNLSAPFYLEHCTIRVIRAHKGNYELYSFGSEMPQDQYVQTMPGSSWLSGSILTTVETKIGMCDFKEFREKDICRITSIPLTKNRADAILKKIEQLNKHPLRFNYIQQNCLSLAYEVMKLAGYSMPDLRVTIGQLLRWKWSNSKDHPYLSRLLNKTDYLMEGTTSNLLKGVSTVFSNCLILLLGGRKMSRPLIEGTLEEKLSQNRGIISFSRLIRSLWDLLDENISTIYHSYPLIEWQLKQRSTWVVHTTGAAPNLYIYPS